MKPNVLDKIPVLPTLLSLGNAVCGFTAILYAADGISNPARLEHAAWMIFLAMVFDALDGQVARLIKKDIAFGEELDSLCDVVSFGIAPAFLAVQLIREMFPLEVVWALGGLYVLCALMRLARFNVACVHDEKSHIFFTGLPSPAAAGVTAGLVLIHFDLERMLGTTGSIALWILPFVMLFLGPFMISNIRYVHLISRYFRLEKPFAYLAEVVFVGMLAAIKPTVTLWVVFTLYMFSGPFGAVRHWISRRLAERYATREAEQDAR